MNIIKINHYEGEQICSICQDKFTDKDIVLLIRHCENTGKTENPTTSKKRKHIFHETCMKKYIDSNDDSILCPLDRQEISCLVNMKFHEIEQLNIINFSHNYYELLDNHISTVSIIDHINLNYKDKNGKTLLYCASQRGNFKLIKKLIKLGSDPTIPDDNGFTALMASVSHNYTKIVKYLLKQPSIIIDINRVDNYGLSAYEYANKFRHFDCFKLFLNIDSLDHGILKNMLDKCIIKNPKIIELVKKYLGLPTLKNQKNTFVPTSSHVNQRIIPHKQVNSTFNHNIEAYPELIDLIYQPLNIEYAGAQPVFDCAKHEIDNIMAFNNLPNFNLIYASRK